MTDITLNGRTYRVEKGDDTKRGPMYLLHGARGACYGTLRYVDHPSRMFLIKAGRGFGVVPNMPDLTDVNGVLEAYRSPLQKKIDAYEARS